jgi:hypothetical protein
MSTDENVFYLYERNSSFYYDCKKQGNFEKCPNKFLNKCQCIYDQPVLPVSIGENDCRCHINKKCYIKPGEKCPICLEKILTKKNALLTPCGHSFHKTCIFEAMEIIIPMLNGDSVNCPICRSKLGWSLEDLNIRYNAEPGSLDEIENFWWRDGLVPRSICQTNKCVNDHYLGMNKNCENCLEYRKTGNIKITS